MLSLHDIALRQEHRYRRYRSTRAIRKTCGMLIRNAGVRPLDSKTIRKIKDYAHHTLLDRTYASWLIFYATFQGTFTEGCIPDDFFMEKVLPRINWSYRPLGRAKSLGNRILGTNAMPNKAYYVNGSWHDAEGQRLVTDQLDEVLFSSSETVYVKPEDSNKGRGILVVHRRDFHDLRLPRDKVFVVQRAIDQHAWFDRFYKGAVATLRVTTAAGDARSPKLHASYLRLGYGMAQVISSAESLRVPVIDKDGTLGPFASSPTWERYRKHPTSGHHFDALQVPFFQKAVAVCEQLHRRIPQLGLIGWDVAIDESGEIEIMEFNTNHPEIAFSEASTGPCFSDLDFGRFAQAD